MKKLLCAVLSGIMAFSTFAVAVPITASAAESQESVSATYGDFEYDSVDDYCTIIKYNGSAANVTIPSEIDGYKVLSIWQGAFYNCTSMESVTIPNSIEYIGLGAFSGCTNLKNIDIRTSGNNIIRICDSAFNGCTSLKSIVIPGNVEFLWVAGGCTFGGCTSLKNVVIENGVTVISGWLFECCSSLESISIPDSVTEIQPCAFFNCTSLKSITIPKSVTNMSNCSLGYGDYHNTNKTEKDSNFTIKGYKGTAAETYAKENGFKFIEISEPTSVSLNKTALTLDVGKSYTLTKTVSPSNAVTSYTWRSSNTSVATVDGNGKVTAKASGTATITVKTSNGKTATCKVTVNLPAPQITGLANTTGGIKLSWNKVDGAYGYRLYYKPVSGGWKRFKDTTATSFTDSGVVPNKTETYTIRCIDKNGNTVSGFNSKGWPKKYTPVAPTISKLDITTGGIKLSWNKIAGVYGYRLYYKSVSGGWKRFKDTTATSFTDSGVSPNRTETYTIRCIDKNGKTVSGFNSKGWSKKYTPVAPTITRLSNTSKGVSVTWNKIAGVYGYRLYRKYDGGSWTRVKDTTSTSFTDSGAKKGKKVTYTVRCIDRKGKTVSGFNSKGWSITRK